MIRCYDRRMEQSLGPGRFKTTHTNPKRKRGTDKTCTFLFRLLRRICW